MSTDMEKVMQEVVVDLADFFSELDDQEEPRFGEYARVECGNHFVDVLHATEPWGIRISVHPLDETPI